MKKFVFLIFLIVILMIQVVSALQISYEDFESNSFSGGTGWTGGWSYTGVCDITTLTNPIGSYQLRGQNQCDAKRVFDSSIYQNTTISFYASAISLEGSENCVYSYYNGTAYTTLLTILDGQDDGVLRYYEYNVSKATEIRMKTNGGVGDSCFMDNIAVNGESLSAELNIYSKLEYQKNSMIDIEVTSSLTNTEHIFSVFDSNNNIICNETLNSPSIKNTIFTYSCQLPDTTQINAYITLSTLTGNITKSFNIVDSKIDLSKLKIERVYFSPQVLQGGNTEIFAVIKNIEPINDIYVTLTFPDNTTRRFSMSETYNNNEYRGFITDTFQTNITKFEIIAESGIYYDKYNNQYYVAPYSVDFVDTVNYVNKVLEAKMEVHGTEYLPGDNAKIWLQLQDEFGQAVNDGVCEVDIYTPGGGYFIEQGSMTNMYHDGIYYYNFVAPLTNGVYPAIARCYFSGTQDFETADNFTLTTGTQTNTYINTQVLDLSYHELKEGNAGGQKRLNVTYTFNNMCGINTSQDLLTGVTFTINAQWDSIINDNIEIYYYNYNTSNWTLLPNKIISPNLGTIVTNTINLNNLTTYGIVNSSGSSQIRLLDTNIIDSGTSILNVDYLSIGCNRYTDPQWQEVKGSSEAHISSRELGDLGYYAKIVDYGELRNNTFLDGFDIYYTIGSQTASTQPDVIIHLPLFYPFPATHVTNVQIYNSTSMTWDNISYTSSIDSTGRDNIIVTIDIQPETNYAFKVVSENYWKQKIFSDADNIKLLNDFIEIACWNYVLGNNLTNYTIPNGDTDHYPDDNFYASCDRFLTSDYKYELEFTEFENLNHFSTNFTLSEMYTLESRYAHVEQAGHEMVSYGQVILDGLSVGADYSLALLSDPFPPDNPYYAKYFANISTGAINYFKNQQNYANLVSGLSNISSMLNNINYSVSITPDLVWNFSNRTLTAQQESWIGGTEYSATETTGKVVVRMSDQTGVPVTGGNCTMTTFFNGSILINQTPMTEYVGTPEGVYYVDFNLTGVGGVYPYTVDCLKAGKNYYLLGTYHIFDNTYTTDLLENINSSLTSYYNNILSYLIDMNTTIYYINGTVVDINNTVLDIESQLYNIDGQLVTIEDYLDQINTTVTNIYDILINIDNILDQINYTINSLNETVTVDLSGIEASLLELREEVDYSNEFSQESIFLITDSIVATQKAQATDNQEEIIEELRLVETNLKELKDGNNEEQINPLLSLTLLGFLSLVLILLIYKKKSKQNQIHTSEGEVI